MAKVTVLTDKDKALLQQVIDSMRQEPRRVSRAQPRPEPHQAPEVYVARTPNGGIGGLQEQAGTGIADRPGYADCNLYKIVEVSGAPQMMPISGLFRRVYNLSHEAMGGRRWVAVSRDKFGNWLALLPGTEMDVTDTGTGTYLGPFQPISGTGTGCQDIPGFSHNAIPISTTPDFVLGIENGCLVRVAVGACP